MLTVFWLNVAFSHSVAECHQATFHLIKYRYAECYYDKKHDIGIQTLPLTWHNDTHPNSSRQNNTQYNGFKCDSKHKSHSVS
jgi:hypothetical protein